MYVKFALAVIWEIKLSNNNNSGHTELKFWATGN
jgi:hypothetical protein